MQWYYSNNGSQLGPVSTEVLKGMIADGRVKLTDLVWREGMSDWLPVSSVSELTPSSINPPVQSSSQVAPPVSGTPNPYQAPATPHSMTQAPGYQGVDIPNYLWQSIVVTLFCCLPTGIAAIVYASKVNSLKMIGDIHGAKAASESAKTWCWVSFGLGLAFVILRLFVFASSSSISGY